MPPYDHGIHLAVTKANSGMLGTFETRLFHLIKKFEWQPKMQKYKDALKIKSNFGKLVRRIYFAYKIMPLCIFALPFPLS